MGICCLGLSVMCHRGFRVFCADPPFRCIRCSSCGFGCSTGRNVHAEVTGGSGSVMMWLTSRPRAPTASGLLSGYPVVVPQSGDSVTRRRYRVQRSNRRLGSPPLAALFFDAWPIAGPSIAVDAPTLGGVRNAGHEWRTTCFRYRRLANVAYRSLAESSPREPLIRAGRGVRQRN
jgi:hypothetical protein